MATSREVSWRRCSFVDLLAQVLLRGSLGAPLSQVLLPGSPGAGAYLWLYHACSASRSGDLGAGASVRISCGSLGTGASSGTSWRRCFFVDLLAQVLLLGSLVLPCRRCFFVDSLGAGAYLWLYHACSASRSGDLGAGASVRISCGSLGTGASSGTSWRRCFFVDLLAQVLLLGSLVLPCRRCFFVDSLGAGAYLWLSHACSASRLGISVQVLL
jgi:hypothetical protein